MATNIVMFNPEQEHSSVLEAFVEFVAQFGYQYEALNREAPTSLKEVPEIALWKEKDRRKVFLGRYSHRALQMLYEDLVAEEMRDAMTFKRIVKIFTDHFKQSTNQTLANYRFRKLTQEDSESFESFCIRIKRESKNCSFKCGEACTVINVMIKDQILFGTRDADIRKTALKEDWDLATLLMKGRAMEASDMGAAIIKKEPPEEVKRTKPGKYSKKSSLYKSGSSSRKKDVPSTSSKHGKPHHQCKTCSDRRCEGEKKCRGRNGTCFACQRPGHYAGAEMCKKKKHNKMSRRVDHDSSSSESEGQSSEHDQGSTQPDSSSEEEGQQEESEEKSRDMRRVFSRLSTIRRIGGRRYANTRRTKSRYTVSVIIKEMKIPVFCDTGADICIMSKATAKILKLDILPTAMVIRPYGSKSQKCKGETCCTIMFNKSVANAKFYILDAEVETLISGAVSEELGIIKMNPAGTSNVLRTPVVSKMKSKIMTKFPSIFKGTGTLRDHKVKFYIDEDVPPVYQPPRPSHFILERRWIENRKRWRMRMSLRNTMDQLHGCQISC